MRGPGRRLFGGPTTRLQRSLSVGALTCLVVTLGIPLAKGQRPERPVLRWNEQLNPLVRFVERERGLRFQESIGVRVVPADRFDRAVAKDATPEIAPRTVRALARVGIEARSKRVRTRRAAASVARFDPGSNTIDVRAGAAGDARRSSLVDALTDALQHQTFDLSLPPRAATERGAAWRAVLVGDRTRVVDAFGRANGARAADRSDEPTDAFELVAVANEHFASQWGTAMVQQTFDRGGNTAVNALFVDPPTSRADVLRRAFGDPAERALTVRRNAVDEAPNATRDAALDEIGAIGWFALSVRTTSFDRALATARTLLGENTRVDRTTGCVRATIEVTARGPWGIGTQWRDSGPHSVADLDSCADNTLDFAQSDGIDAFRAFMALPDVAMDLARRRDRSVAWGLCVALVTAKSNGPAAVLGDVVLEPTQTSTGRATCDDRAEFSVAPPTPAPQSA